MMQIYLVHSRHGKKIAHQEKEAEADKKVGWKEVSEDVFYNRNQKAPEPVKAGQDTDLVAKYEAAKGKKPHHRMTNESIKEALNEQAS